MGVGSSREPFHPQPIAREQIEQNKLHKFPSYGSRKQERTVSSSASSKSINRANTSTNSLPGRGRRQERTVSSSASSKSINRANTSTNPPPGGRMQERTFRTQSATRNKYIIVK